MSYLACRPPYNRGICSSKGLYALSPRRRVFFSHRDLLVSIHNTVPGRSGTSRRPNPFPKLHAGGGEGANTRKKASAASLCFVATRYGGARGHLRTGTREAPATMPSSPRPSRWRCRTGRPVPHPRGRPPRPLAPNGNQQKSMRRVHIQWSSFFSLKTPCWFAKWLRS